MARYVVLYFEDNEEAERIANGEDSILQKAVALVPAPTLFCEDPFSQHGNKKAGYFRGKKYGWWVCSICGKPTKGWGKNYRAVVNAAVNLLEEKAVLPPPGWDQ